ncbi:hypothetical protein CEXT_509551 [Caerostris extrusa]|uniref:Uncharacterized protein n=1 Tax=Caerostris extrusa TaxID=172846 RepID=A0AAV4V423_CAEEX|nr:hypothetical protein CEXT_509551 [Caerostris extrusa]
MGLCIGSKPCHHVGGCRPVIWICRRKMGSNNNTLATERKLASKKCQNTHPAQEPRQKKERTHYGHRIYYFQRDSWYKLPDTEEKRLNTPAG